MTKNRNLIARTALITLTVWFATLGLSTANVAGLAPYAAITSTEAASFEKNADYFEVHMEHAVYVFDDRQTFEAFKATGEVAERRIRVGAGPAGKTLVFVVSPQDRRSGLKLVSEEIFDGELEGSDDFYAEIVLPQQVIVFDSWSALNNYRNNSSN